MASLSFSYHAGTDSRARPILQDLSLDIPTGSYCSLVGPSGCGKSTLLLCIAGLVPLPTPSISLNGLPPDEIRRSHQIGFVFQKPVFFEWKTILDNVSLPARISGKSNADSEASRFLNEFSLTNYENAYPHQLSGGMLARAALARALVVQPGLLLLDEAFNHLDEVLRDRLNLDIQDYWLKTRPSVIAVTHSIAEAVLMSDFIVVLTQRPARVAKIFDVPFERPRKVEILTSQTAIALAGAVRQALEDSHKNHAK